MDSDRSRALLPALLLLAVASGCDGTASNQTALDGAGGGPLDAGGTVVGDGASHADALPVDTGAGTTGDAAPCPEACSPLGASGCDSGGLRRTCVTAESGCHVWKTSACPELSVCSEGLCAPCTGQPGTFHDQHIESDGEERFYYLHVPDGYQCGTAWPLLVDLHGTAGPPAPEEAYALAQAVATAKSEGFILVRPRSRSSLEGGSEVFRWDQNPGDPERNAAFIRLLVADLGTRYNIASGRIHVMGFSSGTNQTSVLLSTEDSPFSGYGFVGGGAWTVASIPPTSARFYLTTGFRDYMRPYHENLLDLLDGVSVPAESRLIRETDAGHDLYGWMYSELWAFLDRAERPLAGQLEPGWSEEPLPVASPILELADTPDGEVLAAGAGGKILRRAATGEWSQVPVTGTLGAASAPLTGICLTPLGLGIAVGGGAVVRTEDGGATWEKSNPIKDFGDTGFGNAYMNSVTCTGAGEILAGGYWSGALSNDGIAWADVPFMNDAARAQVASLASSPWGTWTVAGYYTYLARSTDGATFVKSEVPFGIEWVLDVTPVTQGVWVAVGEGGQILRSEDDGAEFDPTPEAVTDDLYAVSFRDDLVGLAVGRRGAAAFTSDGGLTWADASCGLDRFLGDVLWLSDGTALVAGEGGSALRFEP